MQFDANRRHFQNTANVKEEEAKYLDVDALKPKSTESCLALRQEYTKICKKASKISNIKKYYENGMFDYYYQHIPTITSMTEIKSIMEEFSELKALLNLKDELGPGQSIQIEDYVIICIKKRTKFKYQCLSKEQRDNGHDAEILRHIFHHNRLKELKYLHNSIQHQFIKIKEAKRRKREAEDLKRKEEDDLEFELDKVFMDKVQVDTESPGGPWTKHVTTGMTSDRKEKHYHLVSST
jgi:hypothetical protein